MVLSFRDKHGHYLNIDTDKKQYNKEVTADSYCILVRAEDYADIWFMAAYEDDYEFNPFIKVGERKTVQPGKIKI